MEITGIYEDTLVMVSQGKKPEEWSLHMGGRKAGGLMDAVSETWDAEEAML